MPAAENGGRKGWDGSRYGEESHTMGAVITSYMGRPFKEYCQYGALQELVVEWQEGSAEIGGRVLPSARSFQPDFVSGCLAHWAASYLDMIWPNWEGLWMQFDQRGVWLKVDGQDTTECK